MKIEERIEFQWAWAKDGILQPTRFISANKAIKEMRERLGYSLSLKEIHELGYRLVHVKVVTSAELVLTPCEEQEQQCQQ